MSKKYLIFLLTVLGLVIMSNFNKVERGPSREYVIQKELRVELNKMAPLPGAIVVGTSDSNKFNHAFVDDSYNSTLTLTQIQQYYNEQFIKNGWQFYKEKPITIWGKDYGGKGFIYSKGDYKAFLEYTAPNPDSHQTFCVTISWKLNNNLAKQGYNVRLELLIIISLLFMISIMSIFFPEKIRDFQIIQAFSRGDSWSLWATLQPFWKPMTIITGIFIGILGIFLLISLIVDKIK